MPRIDWLRGATFAHRGLHEGSLHEGGVAENSPSAFRAAIARGLGIECDVQLTRDGGAAVFHDFTLERLTAQQGEVCARTLTEMQQITLKGSADKILSLGDMLALVGGRVPLLIEVKMTRAMPVAPLCEAVAREVAGHPHAAVMSFDPRVGAWFARHAPQIPRGLVMSNADKPGPFGPHLQHVPGGAGQLGDDGPVLAGQGVEQGALAGVGPAHQGNADMRGRLAPGGQPHVHPPPVEGRRGPPQEPALRQPVHQLHGAVVLQPQGGGELADRSAFATGKTLDRQHCLVLLGGEPGRARGLLAEALEAPQGVAQGGQ